MKTRINNSKSNLHRCTDSLKTFVSGQGKGIHMKSILPYTRFVLNMLVRDAEIINGEALLPNDGRPVIAIASHGPGFAWVPLPALAGKIFMENGCGDVIGGIYPHKVMLMIPGLKRYYKKLLGTPTEIKTVADIVNVLKKNEIGFTATAPEGANCLFSFNEYVAPFRSKGMIAAAIKADTSICLVVHQGAEEWKKTVNLPFGWTVPLTNGIRGIHITFPPYKKIDHFIALCRRYQPSISSKDLHGISKRIERSLLHTEIEKIRFEMNLMTDEVKELMKMKKSEIKNADNQKSHKEEKHAA